MAHSVDKIHDLKLTILTVMPDLRPDNVSHSVSTSRAGKPRYDPTPIRLDVRLFSSLPRHLRRAGESTCGQMSDQYNNYQCIGLLPCLDICDCEGTHEGFMLAANPAGIFSTIRFRSTPARSLRRDVRGRQHLYCKLC